MDFAGDEWRGRVGKGWAAEWERTDRSFSALTPHLLAAVMASLPQPSTQRLRVLDIGCGAGETALALADARPDVDVTGIDVSEDLVAVAQARVGDRPNCHFIACDAATWRAPEPFDAALSRHGVMFFDVPAAAFAHLRGQLRPGAPLVFSCFRSRAENNWAGAALSLLDVPPPSDPHLPGPFAFADDARVAGILAAAGWRDAAPEPVDFSYVAGAGDDPVTDALSFFARIGPAAPLVAALSDADRNAFRVDFAPVLMQHLRDGAIQFPAAAWLWRARA